MSLTLLCFGPFSGFAGVSKYLSLRCCFARPQHRLGLRRLWGLKYYSCPHRALRSWNRFEHYSGETGLVQDVAGQEMWKGRSGNSAEMQQRQHRIDPVRLVRPIKDRMYQDTYG